MPDVSADPGTDKRGVTVSKWQQALRSLVLPPTTKAVALWLSTYAEYSTGEHAYPSQATLAACAGLSTRTVRRHLRDLREVYGLIERTKRGGTTGRANTSDEYRLVIPDDVLERCDRTYSADLS